jgi:hypothetical protein
MHFFGRGKPALPLALFAERMGFNVSIPDPLPRTTVTFVRFRVTLVFVVLFIN